jgi:hypothetical protein
VTRAQVIGIGTLMELCYLSFYLVLDPVQDVVAFIVVQGTTCLLLVFAVIRSRAEQQPRTGHPGTVAFIVAFGILFRLTLIGHGEVGSDDIHRYVWDGKVAAQGINPFAYAPTDSALQSLRTETLPEKINFPAMRTVYPPLAQGFFLASHLLFGGSIAGLKFLLVLCDTASIGLLVLLLRRLGLRPEGAVLYAWSPLPVLYFGLDGHIDALGIVFMLLFMLLLLNGRPVLAAIALGGAALAKLVPLVLAPLGMRSLKDIPRAGVPLITVAIVAGGYWLYREPMGGLFESLSVFGTRWEFNGSLFAIVHAITGSSESAHAYCAGATLLWALGIFLLDRPLPEKVFLIFLGMILFAPVVHPWYLTWIAALLTLRWSTATFMFLSLSNLSNLVVYQYRLTAVWQESLPILLIEYVPLYAALAWALAKGEFRRSAALTRWPAL